VDAMRDVLRFCMSVGQRTGEVECWLSTGTVLAHKQRMARFYFDFHDANGILRDEAGEELPSATVAKKEALKAASHTLKDLAYRDLEGCIVIEVRDG
jgi:hypothetical protein